MRTFEVHITGEEAILEEFKFLGIKTLEVELLDREERVVGKEYMCSLVLKAENLPECKQMVATILTQIKSEVFRIKIETPFYLDYLLDAVYVEVHFPKVDTVHPFVRNVSSNKFVSTKREYNVHKFLQLRNEFINYPKAEFELCLYDSNVNFDNHWIKHFE